MERISSKADLHLHTTASDGTASVPELLAHVARTDLRVIAITDHDTISAAREARRLAGDFGIEVIVGEEVSTRDGHLLVLFLEEELPPGRSLAETAAAAHAQGALVIAPHPFDYVVRSLGRVGLLRRRTDPAWAAHVDAIETFNAGVWTRRTNRLAAQFAARLGLPAIGGSDAHHLPMVGRGFTRFPGRTAADVRQAILSGQTRAEGSLWGAIRVAEAGALQLRRGLGELLAPAGQA